MSEQCEDRQGSEWKNSILVFADVPTVDYHLEYLSRTKLAAAYNSLSYSLAPLGPHLHLSVRICTCWPAEKISGDVGSEHASAGAAGKLGNGEQRHAADAKGRGETNAKEQTNEQR